MQFSEEGSWLQVRSKDRDHRGGESDSVPFVEQTVLAVPRMFNSARKSKLKQMTLTIGGSITVWLVSSFTSLHSAAALHTKTAYVLPRSSPVLLNWRPAVQRRVKIGI